MKKITVLVLIIMMLCSFVSAQAEETLGEREIDYTLIDTSGMTKLQKAVVITAESFYLRGNRAQYDMGKMYSIGSQSMERRLVKEKAPEDYTLQNVGYTDCSGFVYDVYWNALDMRITPVTSCWTKEYIQTDKYLVLRRYPATEPEAFDTPEEREAEKKAFLEALQPGDMIVYRYAGDGGGHTMLYVGNGMMFHASGNSYKTDEKTERYEAAGTYLYDPVEDLLFNPEASRYLFNMHGYAIQRPLDKFQGALPKSTRSRVDVMRGIFAEKLSSHTASQTVNPGESVTFTFSITNYDTIDKVLTLRDTVPENTVYVSGDLTVDGDKLSSEVTVPAGKNVKVSYTVQVKNDFTILGEYVKSESNIENIPVNCPEICIKYTLTAEEQNQLLLNTEKLSKTDVRGLDFVSAVYKESFGSAATEGYTLQDVVCGIFKTKSTKDESFASLNQSGEFIPLLVTNLYGGTNVAESSSSNSQAKSRTRMIAADKLIVGDVIICSDAESMTENIESYMFLGSEVLNLSNMEKLQPEFLDSLLGYRTFAVIRPSSDNNKIALTLDSKTVNAFGKKSENDVAPKMSEGNVFLPIRFVAESLGAEVLWKAEEPKKVLITKGDVEIIINIGSDKALINGTEENLEGVVFLENDRTYVPVKKVFEKLGADVEYLTDTKQIVVTKNK